MKIKRNASCPCNSGKKYKKCCSIIDELLPTKIILSKVHCTMLLIPDVEEECNNALDQLETGNIAYAKTTGNNLYQKHPHHYMVNFLQGCCAFREDRHDEALLYFEKAVQIFPYFSEAYYNIAALYMKKIKIEKAVDALRSVIELEGHQEELGQKAQIELDALENLTQQINNCSLDDYIHGNRIFDTAFAYLNTGRYEMAITLFKKVLTIIPEHAQSYGNMGVAYSFLGKNSLALECLDKAVAIDPNYVPAIINREHIMSLSENEKASGVMNNIDFYEKMLTQSLL